MPCNSEDIDCYQQHHELKQELAETRRKFAVLRAQLDQVTAFLCAALRKDSEMATRIGADDWWLKHRDADRIERERLEALKQKYGPDNESLRIQELIELAKLQEKYKI